MEKILDITPLTEWGVVKKRPLVIAGPCSAETGSQMLETARRMKSDCVQVFRAGIWKPRTRPNSFEGVGAEGLKWLQAVKAETGMLTTTEVANVKHVYAALKAGIDILWIGARTTTNPFAIQEIADALKGVDITVLVKNPVNPDLALWIGAMERFNQSGIKRIGAIHRGFSAYGDSKYRNPPHWQIALDLKRKIPQLPLINDPSHISGNAALIEQVSQKAMDLNFDGLMIETHRDPSVAWSDKSQQITPEELIGILKNIKVRKPNSENQTSHDNLEELRAKIDNLDGELLDTLENRMQVVEKIGRVKKENDLTIFQSSRFNEVLQNAVMQASERGLSSEFIEAVFKIIHDESIRHQTKIMNQPAASLAASLGK